MANVQDIIQTYIQLNNLLLGRRQQQLAEENAQVNRLALMQEMGSRMSDFGAIQDLADQAEASNMFGGYDLNSLLGGTAPSEGTTRRGAERAGLESMTPERRGRLEEEAGTHALTGQSVFGLNKETFLNELLGGTENLKKTFKDRITEGFISGLATGQDQGSLAQAHAMSQLPEELLRQGAETRLDTRVGAQGQAQLDLQATIAAAGHRLQWAGLEQSGAQNEAELQQRDALTKGGWAHEFNMQMGLAKLRAESDGDASALGDLQNIASFIRNFEAGKTTMSRFEAELHFDAIKNHFDRLRAKGYDAPDWTDVTVDDMLGDRPYGGIQQWWESRKRGLNR